MCMRTTEQDSTESTKIDAGRQNQLEVLNHTMAWGAAAAAGLAQARSQGEQRRLDELARLELARWHGPRRFAGVCG